MSKSDSIVPRRLPTPDAYFVQRRKDHTREWETMAVYASSEVAWRRLRALCIADWDWEYQVIDRDEWIAQ